MNVIQIAPDSTDQTLFLHFHDPTDGTSKAGLVNTDFASAYFRGAVGPLTAIVDSALFSLATTHTEGGFIEAGNGNYRFDLPDAAVASGVSEVLISMSATGAELTGGNVLINLTGNATLDATEVIPELTHYCDGVTSRSIISLNAGFAGTLALEPDIGDATISTVNSAALTGAASVTGTSLATDKSQRQALYTVAALSTTGTYTATVSVTTTDSQTLVSTGTIVVT